MHGQRGLRVLGQTARNAVSSSRSDGMVMGVLLEDGKAQSACVQSCGLGQKLSHRWDALGDLPAALHACHWSMWWYWSTYVLEHAVFSRGIMIWIRSCRILSSINRIHDSNRYQLLEHILHACTARHLIVNGFRLKTQLPTNDDLHYSTYVLTDCNPTVFCMDTMGVMESSNVSIDQPTGAAAACGQPQSPWGTSGRPTATTIIKMEIAC